MAKSILLIVFLIFSQPVFALQLQQTTSEDGEQVSFGPKRQIATIVYCGLGGAVLGLSTLSFYGRPQDYLTNIAIGFGAGVIIGTIYMTWNAATNPDEFYSQSEQPPMRDWPDEQTQDVSQLFLGQQAQPMRFNYTWTF